MERSEKRMNDKAVSPSEEFVHNSESAKATVLVVDDEEPVRKLAAKILKEQGYDVLQASHGGDACLICREYKHPK